jgi:hypothetical protein
MLTLQSSRPVMRPLRLLVVLSLALPHVARAQAARTPAPAIDRYFKLVRGEYSGDRAKDLVAYMGGWFRWPGNAAFDASIDRVVTQLRDAGYVDEARPQRERDSPTASRSGRFTASRGICRTPR